MDFVNALIFVASSPDLLAWILAGAIVGMVVGAIPGLTAAAAIAMLLPITYYMEPLSALVFLYVIGKAGRYGGSISAILFNTPGTAASAATQLDGYPLAMRGKATKAIKVATVSSVAGDFFGEFCVIVGIGMIAYIALQLGPPEMFAIYLTAFVLISTVIGASVVKGLASAALGVLFSMVGTDPITAEGRYTFGSYDLLGGVPLVPLMIGLFVLAEVFVQSTSPAAALRNVPEVNQPRRSENDRLSWSEYRPCVPHVLRSSVIGAAIGVLPGLGSAIAAFVAYGVGQKRARNAEQWGKGALEGVAAPEAANNAVSGPSMAPLLTLGIPGSTIGAILIGVFTIHGIQVGPTLFLTSSDLVYALFAGGVIGICVYGLIGFFVAANVGRWIMKVPSSVLYPLIFLVCFIAAFSVRGSFFDIWVMIIFGLLGWLMKVNDYSPAAFVISFVLAGGAEESFRQTLRLSDDGIGIFLSRPFALVLILFCIAMLIRVVVRSWIRDS